MTRVVSAARGGASLPLRRRLLLAGAAACLAPWIARAAPAHGASAQGEDWLEFDWLDAARSRAVPVRLYWPQAADDARGAVPLVLFSHGIGGSRRGYSWLGRHFAAQGWASLHVQHVGSDRALWAGNPFGLVSRLQGAARDDEALSRVRDVRFALDQLLDSPWGERVDAARVVAAGHSYGANTTLLIAGARVQRDGRPLRLGDERVRAAIVLSAPPFYGAADPQPILQPVRVPTLHVTTSEDVIRIPGYYSPAADRLRVFEAVGSARKALAVYAGGSHSIFTDRTATGGIQHNAQVKQATQALTLAFLREVFAGDARALDAWHARHVDLLAQFSRVG